MEDKEKLEEFFEKLRRLRQGESLIGVDLDLTIFYKSKKDVFERNDRRIKRPLNITLPRKSDNWFNYEVRKGGDFAILVGRKDWDLSGGTIEPDNLSGVFYLSMPLHNRVDGHEARLYSSRVENLYEINTEQLISEGYLGA